LGSAMLIWWLTILTFHTPLIKKEAISAYAKPIAFFTSAIFLLHPIQTQPVNYIIQRATLLATFFYIASLSLYVKARLKQKERPSSHIWKVYYSGSLLMAVISMLSKEIAITLPLAVFLYEFCFLRIKKDFRWKYFTPFFIIMLIMSMAMLFTKALDFKRLGGAVEDGSSLSVLPYFLTQAKVKVTYLRLLFIPLNQNLDYDYPIAKSIFEIPVIFSFLVLFFILLAGIRLFHKYKLLSFGIFWFFITLLPESGIIPIKDIIFEHRLYLPMAGFSFFLVSTVYYLFGAKTLKPMVAILLIIIACYSVLTYRRNFIWKDEFTLWNDVIRKSPKKVRPYNNRGLAYIKQGDPTQAFSDFNRAIQINPHNAEAYYNRGNAYQKQGNLNQALSDYNRAIQINPNYAEVHNNRGNAYRTQGNYNQAISEYTKAIQIDPYLTLVYYNRGLAYQNQGNLNQAISDYNRAIQINPNYAEVYNNRGNAYQNQGNLNQAISEYTKAIQINPNYADAYSNRGNAYQNQGNLNQAISEYTKAIQINPNYAQAYNNRGLAYIKQGDPSQAFSDFNRAIQIDPYLTLVYYNRGLAYQNQGNLNQAISEYTKAIQINSNYAQAYNNRTVVYFLNREYDKSWEDVHKIEKLGGKVHPEFLGELKKASGRER
jgi:tetratricopeptide (TPR) repeat protein